MMLSIIGWRHFGQVIFLPNEPASSVISAPQEGQLSRMSFSLSRTQHAPFFLKNRFAQEGDFLPA